MQKQGFYNCMQLPTPIFLATKIPGPPIPCQSWPHLYRFQTQKMLNYHDLVGSHIFAEYLASLDFRCASAKLSYKGDGLEWCRVCKAVMSMWIYAASLAVKMILRRNTESNKAKANHAADNNCKASGQRWPNAKGCCILQALSVSTCGQLFENLVWSSPNLKCRRRRLRCSESPPVPEFGLQTPPKILNSGTGGEDRHSIYIQFLFFLLHWPQKPMHHKTTQASPSKKSIWNAIHFATASSPDDGMFPQSLHCNYNECRPVHPGASTTVWH